MPRFFEIYLNTVAISLFSKVVNKILNGDEKRTFVSRIILLGSQFVLIASISRLSLLNVFHAYFLQTQHVLSSRLFCL